MATNNVLAQKLNGEDIEPGVLIESETPIDLILGLNSYDNMTYVPNVIGYKYQMALDIIHDNSLNIYKTHFDETVFTYSDSLEAAVYNQYPASSDSIQVRMGTSMTLYLSKDQSKIGNPYGF
jgi:eukaryotic-like serine/threonine-protein kinase